MLRKALAESGNGETIIQTVSKRGYRFLPPVEFVVEDAGHESTLLPAHVPPAIKFPRHPLVFIAMGMIVIALVLSTRIHHRQRKETLTDADREYLIGRHFGNKIEPVEVERALRRFQRATELNPASAKAYAGIADSHIALVSLGTTNRATSLREARIAAERAIRLDSRLALPHASLGYVAAMNGFDLRTARREFVTARDLGFESMNTLTAYGDYLTWIGDLEGARKHFEHAKQNDPISAIVGVKAARLEYFDHRFARAVELLHEVLEREPFFATAHYYLALSYAFQNRIDAALHELQLARLNPSLLSTDEAWIRSLSGDLQPAAVLLEERRKEVAAGQKKHTVLVLPAISVGNYDLAIQALEEMRKTREVELLHLKIDPRFDPLRSDTRFQKIVAELFTADSLPQ